MASLVAQILVSKSVAIRFCKNDNLPFATSPSSAVTECKVCIIRRQLDAAYKTIDAKEKELPAELLAQKQLAEQIGKLGDAAIDAGMVPPVVPAPAETANGATA